MEKHERAFEHIIAITNRSLCERPFLEQMKCVCALHPAAIVLREKDLPQEEYKRLAERVMDICAAYQVPCILHYYPKVAVELGCKNIHLPLWRLRESSVDAEQSSGTKETAGAEKSSGVQENVGAVQWERLGCSIHSVEEAIEAEQLGATYLTAGHIYATDCKRGVPPRGLEFLQEVCSNVQIPVYAIGGIGLELQNNAENQAANSQADLKSKQSVLWIPDQKQLSEVLSHGAAGGCIMSGMMRL